MSNDDAKKEDPAAEEPAAAETAAEASETADEAPAAEAAEEADPVAELEAKLEESKGNTAKMKEKMLRVAADFENFRRRSSREVEEARQRGQQAAVKGLLPVMDNLERATAHVDETTDAQSMADGLRLVHKQFIDSIGKMGIEKVPGVGSGFDPNFHESIQYEHSDEHPAGVIMTELQPGYRMGTMLLRPAMVVVSRGPAPKEEPKAEEAKPDAEEAEPEADAAAEESKADDADEKASDDAEASEGDDATEDAADEGAEGGAEEASKEASDADAQGD